MHVVFRESHGLEETDTPQDLGQSPADLVVLSFSDSDLGAFAAGWHRAAGQAADAAAGQFGRAETSAFRGHLCGADPDRCQGGAGATDRRRKLLVLWAGHVAGHGAPAERHRSGDPARERSAR